MTEVGSAFVTLAPSFVGFKGKLERGIGGDLDRAGVEGGKRFGGGLSATVGGLGRTVFAPLVAAAAGIGIASFFKDAIIGASDLNETASKVQAIFGKGTGAVQAFASKGATALGQTKQQVLDASATFGTFGKAAGLSGGDLAKFSTGFAGLSTDLASFNNTSPEQAVQAIGAALRGESEPIRQYGVLLDDATLRQEALGLGLIKTTKEALTPQQKVLAAQSAIYKQTSDAQGDFERTSGGLANQQRILSAQFTDIKTTVGSALLPAVLSVTKAFGGFIAGLQEGTGAGGAFRTLVVGIYEALRPVGAFIVGVVVPAVRGLFASLSGSGSAAAGVTGAFGVIVGFIRGQLVPGVIAIVTAFRAFVASVVPIVLQVVGVVQTSFPQILAIARENFSTVQSVIIAALTAVRVAFQVVTGVIRLVWSLFGETLVATITRVFSAVLTIIRGALNIIQGVVRLFIAVFTGDWSGAWRAVQQVVFGAGQAIGGLVRGLFALLRGLVTLGLDAISAAFTAAWRAVVRVVDSAGTAVNNAVRDLFSSARSTVSGGLATIGGLFSSGWGALTGIVGRAFDAVRSAVSGGIGDVVGVVRSLPGRIRDALGDLGSLLFSAGARLVQGLADGVASRIGAVLDKMRNLAAQIRSFLPGSPIRQGPLTSWNNGGAGKRLVDLLAGGITDGTPSAVRAMRNLSGNLAVAPSLALGTSSGTMSGGPHGGWVAGHTVTIHEARDRPTPALILSALAQAEALQFSPA